MNKKIAKNFLDKFKVIDIRNSNSLTQISTQSANQVIVTYSEKDPTDYNVQLSQDTNWLVFTDHFNSQWDLSGSSSLPFYEMVNGFYIKDKKGQLKLQYKPQRYANLGIELSVISLGIVFLVITLRAVKK